MFYENGQRKADVKLFMQFIEYLNSQKRVPSEFEIVVIDCVDFLPDELFPDSGRMPQWY